jgi:hypothetical protein
VCAAFLHILRKLLYFQRSKLLAAGCRRTAGYQPAMSAKREPLCGSPRVSKGERRKLKFIACTDLLKNPVATAPGSDLANATARGSATIYELRTTNELSAVSFSTIA